MQIKNRYFCLAAIAGTFHYLFENEGQLFAEHTIKFVYQGAEGKFFLKKRCIEIINRDLRYNAYRFVFINFKKEKKN